MPNWCENDLTVICSSKNSDDITKFIKHAEGDNGELDFEKFVPKPQDKIDESKTAILESKTEMERWSGYFGLFEKRDKNKKPTEAEINAAAKSRWFNNGGYEWCCANWGTKWNADEAFVRREKPTRAIMKFSTAWSPPTPVVLAMSKLFPTLRFYLRFYEGGAGYKGSFVAKNGEVLKDSTESYRGRRGG